MYNGFKNYATWSIFNYISNSEKEYFNVLVLYEDNPENTPSQEIIYKIKNALEDDFKKPGIIDINESERAGLYADILSDALSEIDFLEVAQAFYKSFKSDPIDVH